MTTQRQVTQNALAAWRHAEGKLARANGATGAIQAEVDRHRHEFQRLATEHMIELMDALRLAEIPQSWANPSARSTYQADQDEKAIAAAIWERDRARAEDTPKGRTN
jgi:hypothetical protein